MRFFLPSFFSSLCDRFVNPTSTSHDRDLGGCSTQLADFSLLIPSTILVSHRTVRSFLLPPAGCRKSSYSRISRSRCGRRAGVGALCAVRQNRSLFWSVWSDRRVYTRGLVSREAPSCPTGQTTSRTIARDDECPRAGASETGMFAAREVSGAGAARRRALSAVGPVPRKEALFHWARGSTVTC